MNRFVPWIVPLGLLIAWKLLAATGLLPPRILPTPEAALFAAWKLATEGTLWTHLAVSGTRAVAGLILGGSAGFLLGLLTGSSMWGEKLLDNTVQMLRTIPNLALVPLVILWFGIGESAKVFLIAAGVFFPIYLNTYHGVRTVDAGLKEAAQVYGLRGMRLFAALFPGALPSILVGLRFALGSMWLTLIAAEALAAESGIGFMTSTAREFMQTDVVLVGTLLYALLGKTADSLARLLERKLLPWHFTYRRS